MNVRLPDLVILSAQTDSDWIPESILQQVRELLIIAPATLPETITFQVSVDKAQIGTLQDGTGDIGITAGKAIVLGIILPGQYLRIHSGSAVAADRTFHIVGMES